MTQEKLREIKFRGKRADNGEWVFGYYVRHETRQLCPVGKDRLKPKEIKHLIVVDSFADWNMPRQLQGIEVIPETVGQYTGLYDKNGVEIYEGDILRNVANPLIYKLPFEVAWSYHHGAWFWWELKGDHLYQSFTEDCEVIGNIHDRLELLEEEK